MGKSPCIWFLVSALLMSACAASPTHNADTAYKPAPWFPTDGSDGEVRVLSPYNDRGGATYRVTHPQAGELEVTTDEEGNIVGVRRLGR